VPVDFLFERIQNAQPRIRRQSRSRNRHNKNFKRAAGWGSALVKPSYCYGIVLFTREALLDELAKEPNRSGSTERHPSTKFFGLWKSFSRKIPAPCNSTRVDFFLSSAEVVNATRVVQMRAGRALCSSQTEQCIFTGRPKVRVTVL